jgi:hypothetical protein
MESTPYLPDPEMSPMLQLQTMPGTVPLFRVDVIVNNPHELSLRLDQAVQQLIPTALERRQGILVTQILPNTYTIEVHETVLCGVIQEKRINPETP